MPIPIKIVSQCRKRFAELDLARAPRDHAERLKDEERYCGECQMTVYNFNVIPEERQVELLERSRRTGARLCVARSFPLHPGTKLELCAPDDHADDVDEMMGDVDTVPPSDPVEG